MQTFSEKCYGTVKEITNDVERAIINQVVNSKAASRMYAYAYVMF